ncbi:hypothetical protein JHK85_012760 [Glycine max]|nr:hypothetical protein JHK85_012760 [Glycine max]
MLAMLLLISLSEVATSDLKEGEVVKVTNEQGDAKFVGGGGDLDDFMVICFPPPPPYGRALLPLGIPLLVVSSTLPNSLVSAKAPTIGMGLLDGALPSSREGLRNDWLNTTNGMNLQV